MDLVQISQLRKEKLGKHDWVQCGVGLRDNSMLYGMIEVLEYWGLGPQAENCVLIPGEIWGGSDVDREVLVLRCHSNSGEERVRQYKISKTTPHTALGSGDLGKCLEFHLPQRCGERLREGWDNNCGEATDVTVEASLLNANDQTTKAVVAQLC